MPADWVYRDHVYDDTGALIAAAGTYSNQPFTLTAGVANAQGKVLYDSHNYIKQGVQLTAGAMIPFGSQGRAEAGRATILGYEGILAITPTTWAAGTNIRLGVRVGVFEQDAGTGFFLVDPAYTMFTSSPNLSLNASAWANSRTWVEERRVYRAFSTSNDQALQVLRFRRRCRRRLNPHECFGMFLEINNQAGTTGGVNMEGTLWMRTLVSDEG